MFVLGDTPFESQSRGTETFDDVPCAMSICGLSSGDRAGGSAKAAIESYLRSRGVLMAASGAELRSLLRVACVGDVGAYGDQAGAVFDTRLGVRYDCDLEATGGQSPPETSGSAARTMHFNFAPELRVGSTNSRDQADFMLVGIPMKRYLHAQVVAKLVPPEMAGPGSNVVGVWSFGKLSRFSRIRRDLEPATVFYSTQRFEDALIERIKTELDGMLTRLGIAR